MKRYQNLALRKNEKIVLLMNSNQLFFSSNKLSSDSGFGTKRVLVFKPLGQKKTRNASQCNVNGKMIFGCQERPLKVSLKLYDQSSRNKILN